MTVGLRGLRELCIWCVVVGRCRRCVVVCVLLSSSGWKEGSTVRFLYICCSVALWCTTWQHRPFVRPCCVAARTQKNEANNNQRTQQRTQRTKPANPQDTPSRARATTRQHTLTFDVPAVPCPVTDLRASGMAGGGGGGGDECRVLSWQFVALDAALAVVVDCNRCVAVAVAVAVAAASVAAPVCMCMYEWRMDPFVAFSCGHGAIAMTPAISVVSHASQRDVWCSTLLATRRGVVVSLRAGSCCVGCEGID